MLKSIQLKESRNQVHSKMLSVEKMLDVYLEKDLPSIRTIAKDLALSESTLKRNFKRVFGTSIYHFYLQKKMQQARQLLAEQNTSVKEIAFRLGYEKPSNFIRVFKKHYSSSPGSLRKKLLTE